MDASSFYLFRFSAWNVEPCIPTRSVRTRCGAALIAAVVALTVASVMLFYLLKGTIDTQRRMHSHCHEVQAEWLAAAGIDRAIARLHRSASFTGETWHVPAEQLAGIDAAEVIIKVEVDTESTARRITAQADYPADTPHRTRKTRATTFHLP